MLQGNVTGIGGYTVYDPVSPGARYSAGKQIAMIEVPECPLQLVVGLSDRCTLFIPARTWLYSLRTPYSGR
jgi:hypothetical protein